MSQTNEFAVSLLIVRQAARRGGLLSWIQQSNHLPIPAMFCF